MTEVSSERTRKRRYVPQKIQGVSLTPLKSLLLQRVAEYGIISLPQLARIAGITPKSARRHLRELFDGGLVEVVAVARIALAPAASASDPGLLYGSAPNLYRLKSAGKRLLLHHDLLDEAHIRIVPDYGPKNSLFLAHELAIRDVRVWLELAAKKEPEQELMDWREGGEAFLPLEAGDKPRCVRPDAWFVYGVGTNRLVGLVEVDRSTERGPRQWGRKVEDYRTLYGSELLEKTIGFKSARLLVFAPDVKRRDALTRLLEENAPATVTTKAWLTTQATTEGSDLTASVWRKPNVPGLHSMLNPGQI